MYIKDKEEYVMIPNILDSRLVMNGGIKVPMRSIDLSRLGIYDYCAIFKDAISDLPPVERFDFELDEEAVNELMVLNKHPYFIVRKMVGYGEDCILIKVNRKSNLYIKAMVKMLLLNRCTKLVIVKYGTKVFKANTQDHILKEAESSYPDIINSNNIAIIDTTVDSLTMDEIERLADSVLGRR